MSSLNPIIPLVVCVLMCEVRFEAVLNLTFPPSCRGLKCALFGLKQQDYTSATAGIVVGRLGKTQCFLVWLAERGQCRNFAFRGSLGSGANSTTLQFYLGFETGQMWVFLEFHFCFSHDASVQTAFPQLRTRSCSSLQLHKHALNTGHSLHPEKL